MNAPPILVLVEPKDLVNVASAFRIAKNFGIEQLRLVNPREFDPYRIEGIAHNTGDLLAQARIVSSLDEALADCVWAAALTARERRAKRTVLRPRGAAEELTLKAADGPVAFVAGREDKGLTNEELDRCHSLVTIPTNPSYRSLNLAQAICVLAYESWVVRRGLTQPFKTPRKRAEPATGDQHERLFEDWERMLWGIEFFKTRQPDMVMRSVREAIFRAELDGREATLFRAMALEVVRFLGRKGVEVAGPPDAPPGAAPKLAVGPPLGALPDPPASLSLRVSCRTCRRDHPEHSSRGQGRSGMRQLAVLGTLAAVAVGGGLAVRASTAQQAAAQPDSVAAVKLGAADTALLRGPRQPIFFRHDIHAGQYKIDCQYCHYSVTRASEPGIPSVQTCMGCHLVIGGSDDAAKAEIRKLRQFWADKDKPDAPRLEWVRIHNLAKHAHFPHQRHIKVMGVKACGSCHGDVARMPQVWQVNKINNMGFCISCHVERKVARDCSLCHY